MKKVLLITVTLVMSVALFAQVGDVTTMWPYRYNDFVEGKVYFDDESTKDYPVNIHLLNSRLHYLDKELIREANINDIVMVKVGDDLYYARNKQLLRVITGDKDGFIAELALADFSADKANSGVGAYGSSSNVQAIQKLTSIDSGGAFTVNHMELKGKKDTGTLLPVKSSYIIVTANDVYPANRKGIEKQLTKAQKDLFKKFRKENRIRWKNIDSLEKVLHFLNEMEK